MINKNFNLEMIGEFRQRHFDSIEKEGLVTLRTTKEIEGLIFGSFLNYRSIH